MGERRDAPVMAFGDDKPPLGHREHKVSVFFEHRHRLQFPARNPQ
jgi:hypothetical protein